MGAEGRRRRDARRTHRTGPQQGLLRHRPGHRRRRPAARHDRRQGARRRRPPLGRAGGRRRLQPVRGPRRRGRRAPPARPGLDHPRHPRPRHRRPCAPQPAPGPEIAAILSAPLPDTAARPARDPEPEHTPAPAETNGTGAGAARAVPTPKDLAALRAADRPAPVKEQPATATLRWSSDKGLVERQGPADSPDDAALPTLAQLTTAEQRWADREEDITTVGGDPFEVGQVFARRWLSRLGDRTLLPRLAALYPRIPHRIDGELLRYAARFGLLAHKDDQIDEHDRYAIRAGFWREIDLPATGQPTAGQPLQPARPLT